MPQSTYKFAPPRFFISLLLAFIIPATLLATDASGSDKSEYGVPIFSGIGEAFLSLSPYPHSPEKNPEVEESAGRVSEDKKLASPTSDNVEKTIEEDTPYTIMADDFPFSDTDDGDVLVSVKISEFSGNGTLIIGGREILSTDTEIFTAAVSIFNSDRAIFTPGEHEHGDDYSSFLFRVNDGTSDSEDTYRFTFDVDAVNDLPTSDNVEKTINEDTPYTFSANDFPFTDADEGDVLVNVKVSEFSGQGTLTINGIEILSEVFTAGVGIFNSDRAIFTPGEHEHGDDYSSFLFRVNDGTSDSEDTYRFTFDVDSENDTPTGNLTIMNPMLLETGESFEIVFFGDEDIGVSDPDGMTKARSQSPPGGFAPEISWIAARNALTLERTFPPQGGTTTRLPLVGNTQYMIRDTDEGARIKARVFYRDDEGTNEIIESNWSDIIPSDFYPVEKRIMEDERYTFKASEFTLDPDRLVDIGVVDFDQHQRGKFEFDGVPVTTLNEIVTIQKADIGKLVYIPNEHGHGTYYSGFNFRHNYGGNDPPKERFWFHVDPVNDAPEGLLTLTRIANSQEAPSGAFEVDFLGDGEIGITEPDGLTKARSQSPPDGFAPEVSWIAEENGAEVLRTLPTEQGGTATRLPLAGNTQYIIQDMDRGTRIKARVFYRDDDGTDEEVDSEWMDAVPAMVPAAPNPSDIRVIATTPSQLTVEWSAPDDGGSPILRYEIQRQHLIVIGWDEEATAIVRASVLRHTFTNLRAARNYIVRIRAENAVGKSDWAVLPLRNRQLTLPATVPDIPTNLIVDATEMDELTLTWEAPVETGGMEITGYRVQHKLATEADYPTSSISLITTTTTITGLESGTQYDVRVAAVNQEGRGAWLTGAGSTAPEFVATVPAAPTGVTVEKESETTLSVSWDAPTNTGGAEITGYDVQYRDASESPISWTSVTPNPTDTETTITGLTAGKEYLVRVAAINSVGTGAYSGEASSVLVTLPGVPKTLAVTVSSSSSLCATWEAPEDLGAEIAVPLSYIVAYRTSDPDGEGTETAGDWEERSTTATTVELTDLLANTSYDVRVAAVNEAGRGEFTDLGSATTTEAVSLPNAPTNVVLTSLSPTEVQATWTKPTETGGLALRSFAVEYAPANAPADSDPMSLTRHAEASAVILTGLLPETEYQVSIAAINALGRSEFESATVTTPLATAPFPPRALMVTGTSAMDLEVSWTAPVDPGGIPILRYRVDYRLSDEDETQTGRQPGDWEEQSSERTSIVIQNLDAGTGYDVRVAAINAVSEGSFVQSTGQTLNGTDIPAPPSSLTLTVSSATRIQATWAAPSSGPDVTGYRVEYRREQHSGTWHQIAHTGLSTQATIIGLMAGTTYQVRVRGQIDAGHGEFVQQSATTRATLPSSPENLVVNGSSDDALRLSWLAPSDHGGAPITDYEIGYKTTENSEWTLWTREETGLQETIRGLRESTLYEVQVAAVNSAGRGSYANGAASTPSSDQTNAPLTLTICGQSPTELEVFWIEATCRTGKDPEASSPASDDIYKLYYREQSASQWEQVLNLGTEGHARIYDLSPETAYEIEFRHFVDDTETIYTGAVSTQDATIPSVPLDFFIQPGSDSELDLRWQSPERDGGSEILRYTVRYRESDADRRLEGFQPSEWVEINAPSNEASLSELLSGTLYEVQVAALNEEGMSPYVTRSATTSPSAELEKDWNALKNLYEETAGAQWTTQENWSVAESDLPQIEELDAWSGVEVYQGRVAELNLNGVGMLGSLPKTVGDLTGLIELRIGQNHLEGALPGEMTNLENLEIFHFDGQSLCAPIQDEFQNWLQTVSEVMGSNCLSALTLTGTIEDQTYTVSQPIDQLNLPSASGGLSPYMYTLTPELPSGLTFVPSGPYISGTPQEITAQTAYTFTVTDNAGGTVSADFAIEVVGATSLEAGHTVTDFVLLGNYPNPFNPSTNILVDLPTAADVSVEVFNLLGQRVHVEEFYGISAGPSRSLMLTVPNLPSGVYVYHVVARQDTGVQLAKGRMTLVK